MIKVMLLKDPSHCVEEGQVDGAKPGQKGGCCWDVGKMVGT